MVLRPPACLRLPLAAAAALEVAVAGRGVATAWSQCPRWGHAQLGRHCCWAGAGADHAAAAIACLFLLLLLLLPGGEGGGGGRLRLRRRPPPGGVRGRARVSTKLAS